MNDIIEKEPEQISDDDFLNQLIQKEMEQPRKKFTRRYTYTPEKAEQLKKARENSQRNRKMRREAKEQIIKERLVVLQQEQNEKLEAEIIRQAKILILKQRETIDKLKRVKDEIDTDKIIQQKITEGRQETHQQQRQPDKQNFLFL